MQTTNQLKNDIIHHFLLLDIEYYLNRSEGEILELLEEDTNNLYDFFSKTCISFVCNISFVVGILIFYFSKNLIIGIIQVIIVILTLYILFKIQGIGTIIQQEERKIATKTFGFIGEIFNFIDDVKLNYRENYIFCKFKDYLYKWYPLKKKSNTYLWSPFITIMLVEGIGYSLCFLIGGILYFKEAITIGNIYLIYNYTKYLIDPLSVIQRQTKDLQTIGASIIRINNFLAISEEKDVYKEKFLENIDSIAFKKVSFKYENKKEIFKNLSFIVNKGEVIGIKGRTGIGKTTLVQLLARFYSPQSGVIELNGKNINNYSKKSVRKKIMFIFQETNILNGTIRDNITYFEAIDDDKIIVAINELGLKQWFENFDNGLDTVIGKNGIGLSFGEKQLLMLIRTVLCNPEVLIMDEIESKIDLITQKMIKKALDRVIGNKIAIIIFHEYIPIYPVDYILDLEQMEA